jgi:hypothetical protein
MAAIIRSRTRREAIASSVRHWAGSPHVRRTWSSGIAVLEAHATSTAVSISPQNINTLRERVFDADADES